MFKSRRFSFLKNKKREDTAARRKGPHHGLFDKDENGDKHMWVILIVAAFTSFFLYTYMMLLCGAYVARYPRQSTATSIMAAIGDLGNWRMALSALAGGSFNSEVIPLFIFMWIATMWVIYIGEDRNKLRAKNPKGNARWNDYKKYNKKYTWPANSDEIAEPPENSVEPGNMILSKNVRLNMNIRQTWLNDNVLIVGSPGSGKTRYVVKPNILQFNCSYAITDPSGELLADIGGALMKHGYRIKTFNVADMTHSQQYNPFRYIRKDEDVLSLIRCLMKNTDDSKSSKGDQFFTKAEECLLLAIFYYIYYFKAPEEQNINTVMEMLSMAKVAEETPRGRDPAPSDLDKLFDAVNDESNPAVRTYRTFQQGTGKTLKSILISVGVRMAPFNIKAVRRLMSDDTLHLEELSDRKQALFIITKAEDNTYNFIPAMMYTQLFETQYARGAQNASSWLLKKGCNVSLRSGVFKNSKEKEEERLKLKERREFYKKAKLRWEDPKDAKFLIEDEDGNLPIPRVWLEAPDHSILEEFQSREEGELFMDCIENGEIAVPRNLSLPCHLRMILDEFANIGEIPGFLEKLTTMRKYSISCDIIIQSFGQIKGMYEKEYTTLIDGCSTRMYLALSNDEDLKTVSDSLGTRTIEVHNTSISYKGGESTSESMNKDSMPLMTPSEIRTMDPSLCLILIQGQDPFRDKKYVLEEHPNYPETADADDKNNFNYRQWFNISTKDETPERGNTENGKKKEKARNSHVSGPGINQPIAIPDPDSPYAAKSILELSNEVLAFINKKGKETDKKTGSTANLGDIIADML